MISIISPAKTLDFSTKTQELPYSIPVFTQEASALMEELKKLNPDDLQGLMSISRPLADLNYTRFQDWSLPFTAENARQAILAFKGEVYTGIDAYNLSKDDILYADNHLQILSGLYGVLKPLDLIREYRLEMGTKLQNKKGKNLYEYWGNTITEQIRTALNAQNCNTLVNLASNEYFKAINTKLLGAEIITPTFKDFKKGSYKVISFYAKKARGLMVRFMIKNRISTIDEIKHFEEEGYFYNDVLSTQKEIVFTRG